MKKLATKLDVGNLTLSGRFVIPPMAVETAPYGLVTDATKAHYQTIAEKSGAALILTEHFYVDYLGKASRKQLSAADDSVIPGMKVLTDAVHTSSRSKFFCQISHAGRQSSPKFTQHTLMAPSPIAKPGLSFVPQEMSEEQIQEEVWRFGQAARRVKAGGFDGVEIHAAHGYLLNQFYSPLSNQRTDEYGPQSVENRMRFLIQVVREVRKQVGDDFPIAVRFGGCDYTEGGSTIQDAADGAELLEKEGIDLLDISGGLIGFTRPDGKSDAGFFKDMSLEVKKRVDLPVILTGGVKSMQDAEALLEENAADLIGVCRALFFNPDGSRKKW
ncbi:MAG: NADH:flavin oxidoreductase [Eubacteriales bacterium]|nr:NADH:flavin oxidoreductase [Eubacteriales bacterium]